MKYALLLAIPLALAGDKKPLPGQAGNDDIEMTASVIVDRGEVKQAVGADLGAGYVIVHIKVTPKTEKPLRISPDDFTIISRKDGQRSQALSPGQIAGKGELVVKATEGPGGFGTMTNGPIWGGVTGAPRRLGGAPTGGGNSSGPDRVDSAANNGGKDADNPLLKALQAKELPDKETLEPQEGLLYFPIDGKIKPKDLAVIYKGPAGKLVMEFANPK